jgi:hypothetical protein
VCAFHAAVGSSAASSVDRRTTEAHNWSGTLQDSSKAKRQRTRAAEEACVRKKLGKLAAHVCHKRRIRMQVSARLCVLA